MFDLGIPVNVLTEKPYKYPEALSNLLATLRDLRAEHGLPPVKLLGTTYSPEPNISHSSLQKQARHVGKRVVYRMGGVSYNTLHDVLRVMKSHYRGLHLDPTEVVCAAGISLRNGLPYLHGRLPKDPSVVTTAVLAGGLDLPFGFTLIELSPLTNTVN